MSVIAKAAEEMRKGLLRHVLGIIPVMDVQAAIPENVGVVLLDKPFNRTLISIFHSLHQQNVRVHGFLPSVCLKDLSTKYNA